MRNIIRLVRVQIGTLLSDILSIGNNRKKKSGTLYAGLSFITILLGAVALFYSFMVGKGLMMFNSIELLPVLMMSVTSVIVLFTTVLKVKGTIFGFKDYDMVMALPVSIQGIVASRLILLYLVNMLFVLIVMLPMMIAYGILAHPDILFYIFGAVSVLVLPLLPIVIASFLGTIIAYAASRFRYSNFVSIIVSLGLIIALMGMSFMVGDTGQELVDLSKAMADKVNGIYPLAGMYRRAVVEYDLSALVSFLAISVFFFLLYAVVVGKVFKKMNTLIMTGKYRTNFKLGKLRESSPLQALYQKEIRRYFSSPLYVLNTAIGIVLLTIGAIALIFVDLDQIMGQEQSVDLIKNSVGIFIAFCLSTCCTTMSSISLEGKSLWVIKSLPVEPKTIFKSKLAVNLIITAPALLDALIITVILKTSFLQTFFIVIVTAVFAIFVSLFGLLVNLKFPNFNWNTEVVVIKQSAATMIALFTGMGAAGLLAVCLIAIPSVNVGYPIYIGLMIVVDLVLYRIIMNWGTKQFARLS